MKRRYFLFFLVGLLMLGGCQPKEEPNEQENGGVFQNQSSRSDGFEDSGGHFVSYKEVKKKWKKYEKSYQSEDFQQALDIEQWLNQYAHVNGIKEEQLDELSNNHNSIVELFNVKNALEECKETNTTIKENEVVQGLKRFFESGIKNRSLNKIAKKYEKESNKFFDKLYEERGVERTSKETKNDE